MEFINKIELQGIVGYVNTNKVADTTVARFSVVTEHAYTDKEGSAVIDTTWHQCTAWESEKNKISNLKRGAWVHLVGRIRVYRFVNADGTERQGIETIVNEVEVIPTETE